MGFTLSKPWTFLITGVLLGLITFWVVTNIFFPHKHSPQEVLMATSEKYPHVRPLVLPWDTNLDRTQELIPFRTVIDKKIEEYTSQKKASSVAYYFRDLSNGPYFGINVNTEFNLASLLKVPVLMSYYRWAEQDSSMLQDKLVFDGIPTNRIDSNELTKPKRLLEGGKSYTVSDLLERMIVDSDNDSFKLLVDNIDVGLLADPYNITETEIQSKDQDYTGTIREYSAFFRALYNSSYLTRPYSEKALQMLIKSEFQGGLRAGVPENIEVAHKFGVRDGGDGKQFLHDCGVVYYPGYPYLLCIMTEGENLESLVGVVRGLSDQTYKEVNRQFAK